MKQTQILAISAAAMILLAGSGCTRADATADARSTSSRAATPAGNARTGASRQAASLETVGHDAENLYDRGKDLDWQTAGRDLHSLRGGVAMLTAETGGRPPQSLQRSLSAVEDAVRGKDGPALMDAANALTRDVAELQRPHSPRIPADVTLLDYYGRELEIAADANDLARLSSTRDATIARWSGLRATVLAKGGAAEATRFDDAMGVVQRARTVEDFRAAAVKVLDEVDSLEAVFAR